MTPQERIKADARVATDRRYHGGAVNFEYIEYKEGYIAGATAEHEHNKSERLQLEAQNANVEILLSQKKDITARAQVLVDALSDIASGKVLPQFIASMALEQWKSGKEVGDEG